METEMAEQEALTMPDELDSHEESPYLRRQKPSRSAQPDIAASALGAVCGRGAAARGLAVGYFLAIFALTSPHFVLTSPDDIVVTGNHYVLREEVLGALGVPLTGNLKTGN